MLLNHLFYDAPIDFEKRCRRRIAIGAAAVLLGIATLLVWTCLSPNLPVLYLEEQSRTATADFYAPLGAALIAAGLIKIRQNRRILKDPALKKQREIQETDERNRILGLRCWAYAGYTMFLLLYIATLAAGFISLTVLKVLLAVTGLFAFLLLIFRLILQRSM